MSGKRDMVANPVAVVLTQWFQSIMSLRSSSQAVGAQQEAR